MKNSMKKITDKIKEELRNQANEQTRLSSQRFFKESITCHGVNSATVAKIAKENFKSISGNQKIEIFNLCEELWQSGYLEESFIACNWSYNIRKQYKTEDFKVLEKWVSSYVNNWASCDTLCNHNVGEFITMYPEYINGLKKWAKSENRWLRRAASVSLIIPAKKGLFLADIFQIADILLLDRDDLVQKGYGWMLKAASQAHQKEVFDYVISKKTIMPRTALRYAIEKMPPEFRSVAMKK